MTFLNTEETYKMLQPFLTKEELNANTKAIRQNFKDELYGAVREVLDVLHRYAVKYSGVCYLSKSEIAKRIDVSTRTVVRACNKLSDLGIIVQYETKRHRGDRRQSTNAIVFLTQVNMRNYLDVIPECHTEKAPLDTPKKIKDLNNKTYPQAEVVASSINLEIDKKDQTPYQRLKSFVKSFVEDNKLVYKLYGIWLAQTKTMISKVDFEIALKAARYTMHAIKTKNIKSITGYFNGVLNNLINKWLEEECDMYAKDWTLALDTEYEMHEKSYIPDELPFEEDDEEFTELSDWLNEIDGHPQFDSKPNLENWLEW